MKLAPAQVSILAMVLAGTVGLAAPTPGGDYSFREPPLHSMGIKSLADLRGKPVVIDFWGRN